MKKVIMAAVVVCLCSSFAFACGPTCTPCIDGVDGKNGTDGRDGVDGKNGTDGRSVKGDKGDPGISLVSGERKTKASLAGVAAATRIDHAKNGGLSAGVGLSALDDSEAMAIAVGKSWRSTGAIKEYVLDVSAFIGTSGATETTGVSAAITAHF